MNRKLKNRPVTAILVGTAIACVFCAAEAVSQAHSFRAASVLQQDQEKNKKDDQGGGSAGSGTHLIIGTWKLNEDKSKLSPGTPKNSTVVYEVAGDTVKVTVYGTDSDGKPAHNEWTGKFDGKDYRVTGDPSSDARLYKKINDHTLEFMAKKGDNVTTSGRIVVSPDGKTRTVTVMGPDPKGKKFSSTAVYDKQ